MCISNDYLENRMRRVFEVVFFRDFKVCVKRILGGERVYVLVIGFKLY